MRDFEIGTARAQRGNSGFGSVKISELVDGSPIEVPVCIINGAEDGPCLWIQNGVHGDEYNGAGAVAQLIRTIKPASLRGQLVLIPILNIQAFRAGSRMAPQDGLDMNRIWPGAPLEIAMHLWAHSELVADRITKLILQYANVVVDVHDAGWMGLMSPFVTFFQGGEAEYDQKVRELSINTGLDLVWEAHIAWIKEKAPSSIRVPMLESGIPAIEVEAGGEGRLRTRPINRMHQAFLNVMSYLNMIEDKPTLPDKQIFVNSAQWIRAPVGGFLHTHVGPLDRVTKGQKLATITDLFGRTREVLDAPYDGWIVGARTFGNVATGQYITTVVRNS